MTTRERYLRNHERIKARAIARILSKQKASFCDHLETQKKSIQYKQGEDIEFIVEVWLAIIASEIPDYLEHVLPWVMIEGARTPIKKYADLLPSGYSLAFDIDASPASNYIRDMRNLMLSERNGSILLTTKRELIDILSSGVQEWLSYGDIAKQIRGTDPFVFSKTRAKLIAINEVGRAYWWANHEPGRVLTKEGYVLVKRWATSRDEKVRDTHAQNARDGDIAFDKNFSGTGDEYAPSSHDVNCRCTSTHEIVGIQKWLMRWNVRGLSTLDIKKVFEKARSKKSL